MDRSGPSALDEELLRAIGADLEGAAAGVLALDASEALDPARRARRENELGADGWLLVLVPGNPSDAELARVRNALWPWVHVGALYRCASDGLVRETLQKRERIGERSSQLGVVLAGQRRERVLSPRATAAKFDANSGGWNGEPGRPGYAHFRWMRKYVALFGGGSRARSILDFGSGAGWVGIEAALASPGARLAVFDPSPELVRIAGENARASGIASFDGRVGFGEAPPFEEKFELVISSGVVSFSPEHARWFDGLARCVAKGGRLVIGDLNRESRGMRERRATKPLLPVREMNALVASEARAQLERRGFVHERTGGYQLTRPVPQLMHVSDTKLGGVLSPLLLAWNKHRAGDAERLDDFDSWVMSLRAP